MRAGYLRTFGQHAAHRKQKGIHRQKKGVDLQRPGSECLTRQYCIDQLIAGLDQVDQDIDRRQLKKKDCSGYLLYASLFYSSF